MLYKTATLLAGFALVLAGGAIAAPAAPKLPSSGKARFEVVYFRVGPSRAAEVDAQTGFGSFEQWGVTRSLDGQPLFDRMTEYCTGQWHDAGGQTPAATNGACLYVDHDGDKLTINWIDQGDGGTKQIVGGSGKYSGITGQGTYKLVTDLKAPTETSRMFIVEVALDFQMKRATQ